MACDNSLWITMGYILLTDCTVLCDIGSYLVIKATKISISPSPKYKTLNLSDTMETYS